MTELYLNNALKSKVKLYDFCKILCYASKYNTNASYFIGDLFSSVSVYINLMFQFWCWHGIHYNCDIFDEFEIFYGLLDRPPFKGQLIEYA